MSSTFAIDTMHRRDWAKVRAIYGQGLSTGLAAFTLQSPVWKAWDASHLPFGRLVARRDGGLLGWSALAQVPDT